MRKTGKVHAWFWGHEHRFFVYQRYRDVGCPVCVGNGGVPELRSHLFTFAGAFQAVMGAIAALLAFLRPRRWVRAPKIASEQKEPSVDAEKLEWEPLGFVVLDLEGAKGDATYVDEHGREEPIGSFSC